MDDDDDIADQEPCSYCGKQIYADSPRCPACGNYTDGQGTFAPARDSGQRLPRIWVIAGWLAVAALLLPLLLAQYQRLGR